MAENQVPSTGPIKNDFDNKEVKVGKVAGVTASNKKIILLAVLFALLVFAMFVIFVANKETLIEEGAAILSEEPAQSVVVITGTTISPSTVTVSAGEQVKFTNNHEISHELIQSPADQIMLEGFSIDERITQNSSYSYVFEKSGTYHIQDDRDPTKWNVKVIVE